MLFSTCCTAFAAEADGDEPEVLRVGFFAFPGYHSIDETGRRSGYGYEFLQRLAIHGGWSYEYVGYDGSYADALDMLRSGEVDIVTSVSKTPEREEEFLFSEEPIGRKSAILTVKSGNHSVVAGDYATYEGITVGMLESNSQNNSFDLFAQSMGFPSSRCTLLRRANSLRRSRRARWTLPLPAVCVFWRMNGCWSLSTPAPSISAPGRIILS